MHVRDKVGVKDRMCIGRARSLFIALPKKASRSSLAAIMYAQFTTYTNSLLQHISWSNIKALYRGRYM